MGQKVNPNLFRHGLNKTWKTQFHEKNTQEFADYTIKDLEVSEFMQTFFSRHKLYLYNYKLHYNDSIITIYLEYLIPHEFFIDSKYRNEAIYFKKDKERVLRSGLTRRLRKSLKRRLKFKLNLSAKLNRSLIKLQSYRKSIYEKSTLNFIVKSGDYFNKDFLLNHNTTEAGIRSKISFFLTCMSLILPKKQRIHLILSGINRGFKSNIEKEFNLRASLILLQKFRHLRNFKHLMNFSLFALLNSKPAYLLTVLISSEVKQITRHKLLLIAVKRYFSELIKVKSLRISGIKFILKGRLNGMPRAGSKTIALGKLPLHQLDAQIDYYQNSVHNLNGSYGIKMWVNIRK